MYNQQWNIGIVRTISGWDYLIITSITGGYTHGYPQSYGLKVLQGMWACPEVAVHQRSLFYIKEMQLWMVQGYRHFCITPYPQIVVLQVTIQSYVHVA